MSATLADPFTPPADLLDSVPPPALGPADEPDAASPADSRPRRNRPTTRAGRAAAKARAAATGTSTPRTDRAPRATPGKAGKAVVAEAAQGLHELLGAVVLPMAQMPATGAAMVAAAPDAGKLWAELSVRYPAIAKVFTGGSDGLLFLQLAMLYYPLITTAMAERSGGSLPPGGPVFDPLAGMASAFSGAGEAGPPGG